MTWDEIYERANDKGYGSDELTAKDQARWEVRNLVLEKERVDIEEEECPEDEVDYYTNMWNIQFNENGNITYYEIHKATGISIEKIKEFAHSQLGSENPAVQVTDGEFAIVDPWYDHSGRFELTDKEAEKEWGEEIIEEFTSKAAKYLREKGE